MNEKQFKEAVMQCLNESIDAFAEKIDKVWALGMVDEDSAGIIEVTAVAKGILMSEANQFSAPKNHRRRFDQTAKRIRDFV